MPIYDNVELTPKEHLMMEYQKEESERAREHAITMKRLEIELATSKYAGEIKLKELEAKWSSWLKIPITIVKLPMLIIMALGYLIDSLKSNEPSKSFWSIIK